MKKIIVLVIAVVVSVIVSCQKKYECYCTNVNSGSSIYKETYKGTSLVKKSANKSCEKKVSSEPDSLTNCVIK